MYTLISNDGVSRKVRAEALLLHFEYFNHSIDSSTMDISSYPLPFPDRVVSRMEDALVCSKYPELQDDDLELIDYLQPIDNVKTYMHYSLDAKQGMAIGSSLPLLEEGDVDGLLFTDAIEPNYLNYLRHAGLSSIRRLPEVEKNLETFYHDLIVAKYGCSDRDVVEAITETPNLVRRWYGRSMEGEDLEEFKESVIDVVYERILSDDLDTPSLLGYVRSLCPHLCYTTEADPYLPWRVSLEQEDERTKSILNVAHNRIPLKKTIAAPIIPYDYEFDS